MMAEKLSLNSQKREVVGKKVKQLRAEGLVPAVVYGSGITPANITVDEKEFVKLYKDVGESTIFNLTLEGEKSPLPVLVKEVEINYLKRKVNHISFYKVDMKKEIDTEVPLTLVGNSQAAKDEGAVIIQSVNEIPIRCLPADLPSEVTVDITDLKVTGDSITLSDVKLPEGVTLMMEEDELTNAVVTASAPITEEQEAALEAENAVGVEDVEVTEQGEEVADGDEGEGVESAAETTEEQAE